MNYQYVVDLCNITYDSKGTVIDYSCVDQHTIYFTDIIEAEMYFIELTVLVEVALWSSQFGHEVSLCGVTITGEDVALEDEIMCYRV